MAASEVHELVVKLTPDGIDETNEGLADTQERFEETAESTEDSAAKLSLFAKRFARAGLVFGAALGTFAGVIASRMPIFRESAALMNQTLTEIALKFDEEVRPAMTKFNKKLAETNQEVSEADGPWEALARAVTGYSDALSELPSTPAQRMAQRDDDELTPLGRRFREMQEEVNNFEFELPKIDTASAIDSLIEFIGDALTFFLQFKNNMVAAAAKLGVDIVEFFRTMGEKAIATVKRWLNGLAARFERRINDILDALSEIPGQNFGQVSIARFRDIRSNQEIMAASQRRRQRAFAGIEGRTEAKNERIEEQIDRLVVAMQNNDAQDVNLFVDKRNVGRAVTNYLQGRVSDRGRGFRA